MTPEDIFRLAREVKASGAGVPLTPHGLMEARTEVSKWNMPADHFVVSRDLKDRLLAEDWMMSFLDPAVRVSDIDQGFFGTFFGMKFLSDPACAMEPNTAVVVSVIGLGEHAPVERCIYKCVMA